MKFSNLGMTKAQAWNAYREYRSAIGKSGDQRDRAVMAGYRALTKGNLVIDLVQVMKEAGTFENGLPRLAIVRADHQTCFCWRGVNGSATFNNEKWSNFKCISIPIDTFERRKEVVEGNAIVPLIPPKYRPSPSMIKNYFILWEAHWKEVPKDPALLKYLAGNLYAVVAMWNLTPIEQAVLRRN